MSRKTDPASWRDSQAYVGHHASRARLGRRETKGRRRSCNGPPPGIADHTQHTKSGVRRNKKKRRKARTASHFRKQKVHAGGFRTQRVTDSTREVGEEGGGGQIYVTFGSEEAINSRESTHERTDSERYFSRGEEVPLRIRTLDRSKEKQRLLQHQTWLSVAAANHFLNGLLFPPESLPAKERGEGKRWRCGGCRVTSDVVERRSSVRPRPVKTKSAKRRGNGGERREKGVTATAALVSVAAT